MASVRFEKVTKAFEDGAPVLREFDLAIKDGEFMVFVGPSGCGKTTALRTLAGLEQPSSGSVVIGDRNVNALAPNERDVAMVFQNYALFPHLNVEQNIGFGLRVRRVPKAERAARVREVAAMLGLTDLLGRKPKALSGGQRQRVAMGRAIVREPSVLLMDEPLSNLDAKLRTEMRSEVSRVQRRVGTTTIYVTHDQVEAMTMGHRIAVMRHGQLQQVGTPAEVYGQPANLFVAGFLGSPPMNFIADDGLQATADGGLKCTLPGGAVLSFRAPAPAPSSGVVVGVRPEDARVVDVESGMLRGVVKDLEALGSETLVRLDIQGVKVRIAQPGDHDNEQHDQKDFIARFPAEMRPEIGDLLGLSFTHSSVHAFDRATGEALNLEALSAEAVAT